MPARVKPELFARRLAGSAPQVAERDVEAYFVKEVKALGGDVRKVAWIGRRGAPDRFALMPGTAINFWAEIKRPGGKLAPHQEREIARLRDYDEVVYVLDGFEAVDACLAPYKKRMGR